MKWKNILPVCVGVAVLAALTGTAIGGGLGTAENIVATPPSVDASVLKNFSTFKTSSVSYLNQRNELVDFIKNSTDDPKVADIDFSLAKPVDIGSISGKQAWVAPSRDNVCALAPVEPDGYSASCASIADIKAGRSVLINTPGKNSKDQRVSIVAILADGAPAPYVDTDGKRTALAFQNNVAFASVKPEGVLKTPAGDIDLAALSANQP